MSQIDRKTGLQGNAAVKLPVKAATTANITLSGEQTIDGVSCVTGDRVLVKNQTTASENGIYLVDTGTWNRAPDWDGAHDVVRGTLVKVNQGSTQQGFWYVSTPNIITIGTTSVTIEQASSVLAAVSAFVQTLLDDASSNDFLTTLTATRSETGAVAVPVLTKLREVLSVKDFGATGDGVTDDFAALNTCNTAAGVAGKVMYFPAGTYAISDTFHNEAGVSIYFEPGAEINLLNATTGGAAFGTTPSDGSHTDQVDIWNLSVDCDNIAGENAFGVSGSAGARIWNARARNTLHDTTLQGGKGFQIEGVGANRVQVVGLTLENCSIGIDLHPHDTNLGTVQTVGISIRDVHMTDVDVPFSLSDSFQATPADSWDAFDVHISNVRGRNCGRISWTGGTALGGGIIVADRAYKAKFENMLFVNDAGGFGSTAYGQIGALVRGTPFEFHLSNVVLVADVTHLFDFNFSAVGSPSSASLESYVLADNVRHYGDLTNVVATKGGGSALGPCILTNIEYDSTAASFAGLVDANAAAYTNAFMDARDRSAVTESGTRVVSTGLRTLKELSDYGNGAEDFFRPAALGEYKFSHRKADVADATATALFSVLTANHSRFSIRYQITAFTDSSAASGNAITISGIVAVSRDGQNNITLGTPVNTSESEALDGITTWTLTPAVATSTNEVEFRVTQDNDLNQTADVIVDATVIFSVAETAQQPVVTLL